MNVSRTLLILVAAVSLALVGFALYLQHAQDMLPCPLCIIQRYAFVGIALFCLIAAALPAGARRLATGLGALSGFAGAGVAGWHLWVKANPKVTCGIDPLETSLNRIPTAEWLPFVFKADGLCSTEYAPILGLSIPQWALLWFVVLALTLTLAALRRR